MPELNFDPTIVEAFPSLEFHLDGDRDQLHLNATDSGNGRTLRLISLARQGYFTRHELPGDFTQIPPTDNARIPLNDDGVHSGRPRLRPPTPAPITAHPITGIVYKLMRHTDQIGIFAQLACGPVLLAHIAPTGHLSPIRINRDYYRYLRDAQIPIDEETGAWRVAGQNHNPILDASPNPFPTEQPSTPPYPWTYLCFAIDRDGMWKECRTMGDLRPKAGGLIFAMGAMPLPPDCGYPNGFCFPESYRCTAYYNHHTGALAHNRTPHDQLQGDGEGARDNGLEILAPIMRDGIELAVAPARPLHSFHLDQDEINALVGADIFPAEGETTEITFRYRNGEWRHYDTDTADYVYNGEGDQLIRTFYEDEDNPLTWAPRNPVRFTHLTAILDSTGLIYAPIPRIWPATPEADRLNRAGFNPGDTLDFIALDGEWTLWNPAVAARICDEDGAFTLTVALFPQERHPADCSWATCRILWTPSGNLIKAPAEPEPQIDLDSPDDDAAEAEE